MACTDMGTSPWPVRKTIGIGAPDFHEVALQVEAAQAGQANVEHDAGRCILRGWPTNSWAERKVCARRPTDRSRLLRASHTAGSSSTTKTIGSPWSAVIARHAPPQD